MGSIERAGWVCWGDKYENGAPVVVTFAGEYENVVAVLATFVGEYENRVAVLATFAGEYENRTPVVLISVPVPVSAHGTETHIFLSVHRYAISQL